MAFRKCGWLLSFKTLLAFALIFSAYIDVVQALIDGPFKVKAGGDGHGLGNCDAQKQVLDRAFQEAVDMARDAVAAIDKVSTGRANWIKFTKEQKISATLQVLFNVETGSLQKKITEEDAALLAKVKSVYQRIIDFSKKTDQKVSLYCNDDWLEWKQDPDDGKFYWYSSDHNIYIAEEQPLPNKKFCVGFPYRGAFTTSDQRMPTITWCTTAFTQFPPDDQEPTDPHKYKPSLEDIKRDQSKVKNSGIYIHLLDSIPGQFLHEMTHLLGHADGSRINDQGAVGSKGELLLRETAYAWYYCHWLAKFSRAQAAMNADNYHQFALAMYIGDVDWTTGYADAEAPTINADVAAAPPAIAQRASCLDSDALVGAKPRYPVITEQPFKDSYFFPDMKQAKIASSMISAMIKTEVETAPKAFRTEARAMLETSGEEQAVLAEL